MTKSHYEGVEPFSMVVRWEIKGYALLTHYCVRKPRDRVSMMPVFGRQFEARTQSSFGDLDSCLTKVSCWATWLDLWKNLGQATH